jgi:pyruvate kinase
MKDIRFTKIIASIGPSTEGENFCKTYGCKVDIFRHNFSHETGQLQRKKFNDACDIERKLSCDKGELFTRVSKIADMQGPKHRIGQFKDGKKFLLQEGQQFKLDSSNELGDATRVKLPHAEIFKSLIKGAIILINDGQIKLEVIESGNDYVNTKVLVGGLISDKKGFNIPNVLIKESCITEKDLIDIEDAINIGFKVIVISFVQTPADIEEAKKIINGRAKIIAKLEKPLVMEHLEGIIKLSDGVMIGRGDFAVEATYEVIPVYQKRIIRECNKQNKPVIVATQMLETMINNPFPTRAEISDISTAVYDCADCTMLSAETTIGKYPELAIGMMDKVLRTAEAPENADVLDNYIELNRQFTKNNSVLLKKINGLIEKGFKALIIDNPDVEFVGKISKLRLNIPFFPIFKDEQNEQLCRLYYGCFPIFGDMSVEKAKEEIAKELKIKKEEIDTIKN